MGVSIRDCDCRESQVRVLDCVVGVHTERISRSGRRAGIWARTAVLSLRVVTPLGVVHRSSLRPSENTHIYIIVHDREMTVMK